MQEWTYYITLHKKTCSLCRARRSHSFINEIKFHEGCRYRTYPEDYELSLRNTENEQIEISNSRREEYQAWFNLQCKNNTERWTHASSFEDFEKIRSKFTACPYYDQLNKGIISSHSIFNYANFLTFLRSNPDFLPRKDLLVLDEGHSIENQIIEQVGVSISKKILQRYLVTDILENLYYDYDDSIEKCWVAFLIKLCQELAEAIVACNLKRQE